MQIERITPNWIKDGEKFALIGLPVDLSPDISNSDLPGGSPFFHMQIFNCPNIGVNGWAPSV